MSANSGGSLGPSYEGFSPSRESCHLTSTIMPVEGIDPNMLQLASSTHGHEGQSSFSDAVDCNNEGWGTCCSLVSCRPLSPYSSFSTSDVRDPIGVHENSLSFAEAPEFMGMGIDEFFAYPETGLGELENLDYFFSDTGRVPDEQSFDHPETSELVTIHDDLSGSPWTSADTMEIDVDQRDQAGGCGGPVPAPGPSSPLSPPPGSPVPYHPEGEDGVYLVERIMQAWGPRRRRQYLIRWEGWGPEFDSWEPACNVSAELREEFEGPRRSRRRRHPRRR